MKKKLILLLVIYLNINYICSAQLREGIRDKVEAAQVGFLTKELSLSPEEAQKFWPLYNNYRTELKSARKDNSGDEIELEEKVVNTRKKYKEDFKRVLGSDERVNKLFVAEKNFREMLRKELIKRRMNKQNR